MPNVLVLQALSRFGIINVKLCKETICNLAAHTDDGNVWMLSEKRMMNLLKTGQGSTSTQQNQKK
jgi:hypothetical protein